MCCLFYVICWLFFVARCSSLFVVGCRMFDVWRWLLAVCCVMLARFCLLFAVCWLMFAVCGLRFAVCCLLYAICCSWLVFVRCSRFVVC